MPKINNLTSFGLALRSYREKRGLSQEALADLCGLHRTYIGGIERGERNIGLLNIFVLATALDVPASELLHATEKIQFEIPSRK